MTIINISELRPAGAELFQDSESFLNELSDSEMSVFGGQNNGSDVTSSNVSINSKNISLPTIGPSTKIETDVSKRFTFFEPLPSSGKIISDVTASII